MHLDDSLADEGSTEEGPEWDEEMATCDTCQIKQWVGDLEGKEQPCKTGGGGGLGRQVSSYRCTQEDTKEPDSLYQPVYRLLCSGQRILRGETTSRSLCECVTEDGGRASFPVSLSLGIRLV